MNINAARTFGHIAGVASRHWKHLHILTRATRSSDDNRTHLHSWSQEGRNGRRNGDFQITDSMEPGIELQVVLLIKSESIDAKGSRLVVHDVTGRIEVYERLCLIVD